MSAPSPGPRPRGTETVTSPTYRESGGPTVGQPAARAAPALPIVPGFRVVRWLGGGGMGDVYEVVDEKLGVTFALKIVRPDQAGPGLAERFRQEVRAMADLHHPHIARVYAHGDVGGYPYFTMRFVPGGTLADRRAELRNDPRRAVGLLVKVVDAVEYLHARGKIHRDLKPSNILIDESGEPLLSDFGLVKDVGDATDTAVDESTSGPRAPTEPAADGATQTFVPTAVAKLTRTGAAVGTYAYMSPEQARGDRERIGPATDVWALGVILHELLAGHRPGEDAAETRSERPPGPGVAIETGSMDPELDRIIGRCLSEDPAGRYETAGALAVDLRRWLAPPAIETQPRLPDRRMWIGTAAVAALGLAGAGYLAFRRKANDPDAERAAARDWVRGELRGGRAVELIDGDGSARPVFRFLNGEEFSKVGRDADGWWTVSATGTALIEFLDDPGVEVFTFGAKVRTSFQSEIPTAGLFAAHRRVADAGADHDFQLEYRFQEAPGSFAVVPPANVPPPDRPRANNVRSFKPVKQVAINVDGWRDFQLFGGPSKRNGGGPKRLDRWVVQPIDVPVSQPMRALAIKADGERFATAWEEKVDDPLAGIPDKDTRALEELLGRRPDPPIRFSARGGLGVYVEGGSVSFRDLVIVPGPSR